MSVGLPVVAVVDATGSTAVVWWVDVEASGLNRLCGAWALPEARAQQMRDLLFGRYVLATSGGEGLLDALGVQDRTPIDPELTLAGVARVGEQLQGAHEAHVRSLPRGRTLVAPTWPALPVPLQRTHTAAGVDVQVALPSLAV